jgi:hydroxymethylpyrimidine/phosphomethylpyrimidine kinase
VQADLKTMAALGVFATTAITTVTAQNTAEVTDVVHLSEHIVTAQVLAVLDDLPVVSVKTGLLGTTAIVETVGGLAASTRLPHLVVDPVMVASTGKALVADQCVDAYRTHLLPHALLVTPNLWEAALLVDVPAAEVRDVEAMVELARQIHRLGPTWVLVKGGHLPGVEREGASSGSSHAAAGVPDVLFDGFEVSVLTGARVETSNTHGTGCSLSAAIVAHLARGTDVPTAVAGAKSYVHDALVGSAGWHLGRGHGPLDHLGWSTGTRSGSGHGRESGRVY